MSSPRVRFAPSPTGPLHMGGVRTALYNYLFARKHQGKFILRIEDTDQQRFVPGAEDYIIEALKWCGISPDEGVGFGDGPYAPYRQSDRKALYHQYAEQLIAGGHAYYAFDAAADLEAQRKSMEASGSAFSYNAASRMSMQNSLSLTAEEVKERMASGAAYVVRLKIPSGETVQLHDLVRGDVVVSTDQLDDKVLFKSDGMPTYHLANVVDDYLMKITHVIRGEEWLPSAPLHVLLYRYLGWEDVMPKFAHLPLLLKPDGNGKLSKRDGDRLGFPVFPLNWTDPFSGEVSSGYRERGYYPDSFLNIIALLGWHPSDDKEIVSLDEMIQEFSLEKVSKSGAKFDPEKTKWIHEQYFRKQPDEVLAASLKSLLSQRFGFAATDKRMADAFLIKAVELLKLRVQFENELIDKGIYLFEAPDTYDEAVLTKKWKPEFAIIFAELALAFSNSSAFNATAAEEIFKSIAAQHNRKPGELLQLLRVLISGQAGGVDLFPMIELLGQQEVADRMNKALSRISSMTIPS